MDDLHENSVDNGDLIGPELILEGKDLLSAPHINDPVERAQVEQERRKAAALMISLTNLPSILG